MTDKRAQEIVVAVQQVFHTFGGICKGNRTNPLTHVLEGKPAMFAAGVDILEVVIFVANEVKPSRKAKQKESAA